MKVLFLFLAGIRIGIMSILLYDLRYLWKFSAVSGSLLIQYAALRFQQLPIIDSQKHIMMLAIAVSNPHCCGGLVIFGNFLLGAGGWEIFGLQGRTGSSSKN